MAMERGLAMANFRVGRFQNKGKGKPQVAKGITVSKVANKATMGSKVESQKARQERGHCVGIVVWLVTSQGTVRGQRRMLKGQANAAMETDPILPPHLIKQFMTAKALNTTKATTYTAGKS